MDVPHPRKSFRVPFHLLHHFPPPYTAPRSSLQFVTGMLTTRSVSLTIKIIEMCFSLSTAR